MRPFAGYVGGGVRGVDQRIVVFRPFAALDFQHFLFDLFQGGDEAVEFGFALAFGRFDHQRASNGEGDGRGVEAVVHQAFGDVGFGDAAFGFERTQIDDAFVRDAAVFACVKDGIVFAQAFGEAFERRLKASYVDKLLGYTDQEIVFKDASKPNAGRYWLNGELLSGGETYGFVYKFYDAKERGWLIYDVEILGVSILQTYRSQFDSLMENESFESLLSKLNQSGTTK